MTTCPSHIAFSLVIALADTMSYFSQLKGIFKCKEMRRLYYNVR